jgi:hypothetical protein
MVFGVLGGSAFWESGLGASVVLVEIVAVGYGGDLLLFFANQPVDRLVRYFCSSQ